MRFEVPEGATPIEDVSGLKSNNILTYADLCAAETENILKAVNVHLIRRKNPARLWFSEEYIRRVHRDMFQAVWDWAGRYRNCQTNIGASAGAIREEIAKLCQDVIFWDSQRNSMSILERATRIHHRLAWIHPFVNGNGRHARFMADVYLFSHGCTLPLWPQQELSALGNERLKYLQSIRQADQGNFKPLLDYTARHLEIGK